ncbi:hypothetical protein ACO2I3_10285 [Leptospira interrogans]
MAGFAILLFEWYLAFFNEGQQLDFEQRLEQDRKLRAFSQSHAPEALRGHMQISARMMEEASMRRAWDGHRGTLKRRKAAFLAATLLILAGSAIQLVGTIPGCCATIGILPQN